MIGDMLAVDDEADFTHIVRLCCDIVAGYDCDIVAIPGGTQLTVVTLQGVIQPAVNLDSSIIARTLLQTYCRQLCNTG